MKIIKEQLNWKNKIKWYDVYEDEELNFELLMKMCTWNDW